MQYQSSAILALICRIFILRARCTPPPKAALAAAKARGVKLGGPKLAEARKAAVERNMANAIHHVAKVFPVIREIQCWGASLHQIADALKRSRHRHCARWALVCQVSQQRARALSLTSAAAERRDPDNG
jgi:hypothetical protein